VPAAKPSRRLPAWAVACFLASGAAGLIYEVVWSKQLAYLLGNSLQAVSTVVAAFLTGLALGAYVVGTRVARLRRGARAYALLELGVGLLGLVSMPVLRGLDPVVGALYRGLGGETGWFGPARFLLLFVLLLPPTALMGATLPVLVGHFEHARVGPALARLYAVNTAGAVLGSAVAGFVLLPAVGLSASSVIAAGINAAAAALAWLAAGRTAGPARGAVAAADARAEAQSAPPAVPPAGSGALLPRGPRLTLALLFALSGLGALVFQIAWVRLFGVLLGSSVYSFSAVLAVYLAGLALGSAVIAPWLRDAAGPRAAARLLALLGGLQLGLTLVTLASVFTFPALPEILLRLSRGAAGNWSRLYGGELALVALVLLLPCAGFGAIFPLAARLLQSRDGGHATGLAYAVNTAGTLTGSLLAGFVLIPTLGVQGTHLAAAFLMGAVGLAALALAVARGMGAGRVAVPAATAALAALLLAGAAPRWDAALMSAGVFRPIEAQFVGRREGVARDPVRRFTRAERTLFYREGLNGSVLVATDSSGRSRYLKVGGKVDASTGDMLTQVLCGLLPGAMVPVGARTAIVGLGSGATVSAVLATGVGPVEVMEIEPAVVAASHFFDEPGNAPLEDPRVRLHVCDARTWLSNTRTTYDLIISEPSNPWVAGENCLFTVDFYRRLRARLAARGVFCQWIQAYELSPATLGSLLASFLEVFPTGQAFHLYGNDLLLLSAPPGAKLSLERLRGPAIARQLARGRLLAPESVAAWYACPLESLRTLTRGVRLNRDDLPVVEYQAPRDMYRVGWLASVGQGRAPIPAVGRRASGALFADWPAEAWFLGRARQLTRSGAYPQALATAADAAAEGRDGLARELRAMVEADRSNRALAEAQRSARVAALAGRPAEARDILLGAVRLAPGDARTWVLLAETQRMLGDEGAALEAAGRGAALGDPLARSDARVVEGLVFIARGRPREAAAGFTEAADLEPRSEQKWLFAAQALRSAGDPVAAAALCRRGMAAAGTSDRLRTLLAELERR
jgi:spermidine synthase